MTPNHRNQLLEKRAQLQLRIRFNEFVEERFSPFLEILDQLQNLEIKYRLISFRCIPQEFHQLLQEYTRTEALEKYQLDQVAITHEDMEVKGILEKHPSTNPFRYVLDAPIISHDNQPGEILQEIIKTYRISEALVFTCWLKYVFLLEININDLAQKANDSIINTWYDDTIIFPKDYHWLISYSLEDEWRFKD